MSQTSPKYQCEWTGRVWGWRLGMGEWVLLNAEQNDLAREGDIQFKDEPPLDNRRGIVLSEFAKAKEKAIKEAEIQEDVYDFIRKEFNEAGFKKCPVCGSCTGGWPERGFCHGCFKVEQIAKERYPEGHTFTVPFLRALQRRLAKEQDIHMGFDNETAPVVREGRGVGSESGESAERHSSPETVVCECYYYSESGRCECG